MKIAMQKKNILKQNISITDGQYKWLVMQNNCVNNGTKNSKTITRALDEH